MLRCVLSSAGMSVGSRLPSAYFVENFHGARYVARTVFFSARAGIFNPVIYVSNSTSSTSSTDASTGTLTSSSTRIIDINRRSSINSRKTDASNYHINKSGIHSSTASGGGSGIVHASPHLAFYTERRSNSLAGLGCTCAVCSLRTAVRPRPPVARPLALAHASSALAHVHALPALAVAQAWHRRTMVAGGSCMALQATPSRHMSFTFWPKDERERKVMNHKMRRFKDKVKMRLVQLVMCIILFGTLGMIYYWWALRRHPPPPMPRVSPRVERAREMGISTDLVMFVVFKRAEVQIKKDKRIAERIGAWAPETVNFTGSTSASSRDIYFTARLIGTRGTAYLDLRARDVDIAGTMQNWEIQPFTVTFRGFGGADDTVFTYVPDRPEIAYQDIRAFQPTLTKA